MRWWGRPRRWRRSQARDIVSNMVGGRLEYDEEKKEWLFRDPCPPSEYQYPRTVVRQGRLHGEQSKG